MSQLQNIKRVGQADAADTQAREGDVGEPGEEHA